VNLKTLDGRIAESRWSVQSLTQSFNTAIQGVMFILDACRSVVEIPSASGGAPIRAGPMQQLARELMKGNQVVAYGTQPGGVAADDVPNSSEKNGLYASALSNFINLPIFSLGHALDLTGAVVKVNKEDQMPIYSVSAGTFFLSNPWANNEPADICDMVNSEIWNAAGKHCAQLKQVSCIVRDICPVVTPHLKGSEAPQAIACLAQQKEKWLHNDLIGICTRNEEQKSAGGRTPASTSTSAAALPGGDQSDPHTAIAASVTAPIAFSVNGKKSDAYNVVASTQSDLSSMDFATLALSGWANKTTSLPLASEKLTNEEFVANQSELDRTLANLKPSKKSAYTDKQRDLLVVKTAEGNVPTPSQPSPFKADLTGRSITLRNLPAANAAAIGTFTGDNSSAEIDCYSIPCIGDWIGLRVKRSNAVYRGWASADELKSIAKPAVAIEVEYDGKRIAPNTTTVDAIRKAIRADPAKPPVSGRVHVMALRSGTDSGSSFLASARLSYLDRVIIDLGINPDDIDETVVDLPSGSMLPPAIVNLGSASPK
jgi:hypothetical protein